MTEEQEKAIEKLNSYKSHIENRGNIKSKHYKAVKIALNLIQKQQEEIKLLKDKKQCVIDEYSGIIEQKDKIIDEMAEEYSKYQTLKSYPNEITETALGIKDRILKKLK